MSLTQFGQYKQDFFTKLYFPFVAGRRLLDVGCGDGTDARIFIDHYQLETSGIDIYRDSGLSLVPGLEFIIGSVLNIPHQDQSFDYVFLHDVLHHVDEQQQSRELHLLALQELSRVVKADGVIIIVESNRYNPLFYPHMVKWRGHEHFHQTYFRKLIKDIFEQVQFQTFEAHLYPPRYLGTWKKYEAIMEHFSPKKFLAYNVAIIKQI